MYGTTWVWISTGEVTQQNDKEKSEEFNLGFPGILNAVWDLSTDPRNSIGIIIFHSFHQPSLSTYHVSNHGDMMRGAFPATGHWAGHRLPSLSYSLSSPRCLLFFLHPWRHCSQNYRPRKQMYPVIPLMKMPQWFPLVSWVKFKFLSPTLSRWPPSGPHSESTDILTSGSLLPAHLQAQM